MTTFNFTVADWLARHGHHVHAHIVFRESTMDVVEANIARRFPTSYGTRLPGGAFDVALVSDAKSLSACAPWPVPVVAFAHGLGPLAHEYGPEHAPSIALLLALSPFMHRYYRERLPVARQSFFPNVIDCERFAPGGAKRAVPRFALLNDRRRASEYLERIRPVFRGVGIEVVPVAELDFGLPIWAMEEAYQRFDLVIGCGRSAYEAMSCGRPVMVLGVNGGDGFISRERFAASFDRNCSGFGIRSLRWDDSALERNLEAEVATRWMVGGEERALALEHVSVEVFMPRLVELVDPRR